MVAEDATPGTPSVEQLTELRPARVGLALVIMRAGVDVVERLAADGAEPGAVAAGRGTPRQGEREGVVSQAANVELAVVT